MTTPNNDSEAALKAILKLTKNFEPLDSVSLLILAILEEYSDEARAIEAMKRLLNCFVNWNEMRVARREEIACLLEDWPEREECATRMRKLLNRLFDVRGTVELSFLVDMKPSQARRLLINLDTDIPRTVISVVLFRECPGTTIAISPEALTEAKRHDLVGRSGSKLQLQKLLLVDRTQEEAADVVQRLESLAGPSKPKKPVTKKSKKGPKKKPAPKKKAAAKKPAKKVTKKKVKKK